MEVAAGPVTVVMPPVVSLVQSETQVRMANKGLGTEIPRSDVWMSRNQTVVTYLAFP